MEHLGNNQKYDTDSHEQYIETSYEKFLKEVASGKISPREGARKLTAERLELEKMADRDGLLTDFLNNKGFSRAVNQTLNQGKREINFQAALLAFDIDRLKDFNDSHGHIAGDELIRTYADVITQNTRLGDLRGRLGGDEFGVLLLNINLTLAKQTADRIRLLIIEATKVRFPDLSQDQTVSIGLTIVRSSDLVQSLRERADQALYLAKKERNSTKVFEEDIEPKL